MIVDGDAGEVTSMNEDELAELFERRRGDTSHWSEKPVKAKVGRRGSVVFSVRFSPEELVLLRDRAQETGRTISELIRSASLEAAARVSNVYTRTVDRRLVLLPERGGIVGIVMTSTFGSPEAAQAACQPDQPPLDYVLISGAGSVPRLSTC